MVLAENGSSKEKKGLYTQLPRGVNSSMKLRTTKTVTAVTELLVFGRFGKISPNLPK